MLTAKYVAHSAFALALVASTAAAVPVAPGEDGFLPGTTLAETPALGGMVIGSASNLLDFNPLPAFIQGYRVESEVRETDSAGTAVISHRFADAINIFPSFVLVDGFSLTGYAGFDTDVFFRTDATGDRAPTSVERSADGNVLDFTFGLPLVAGYLTEHVREGSFPVEILTDATSFTYTGRMTVFGRLLGDVTSEVEVTLTGLPVPVLAELTPIPLPAGFPLLGTAALLLAMASRRNRHRPA